MFIPTRNSPFRSGSMEREGAEFFSGAEGAPTRPTEGAPAPTHPGEGGIFNFPSGTGGEGPVRLTSLTPVSPGEEGAYGQELRGANQPPISVGPRTQSFPSNKFPMESWLSFPWSALLAVHLYFEY